MQMKLTTQAVIISASLTNHISHFPFNTHARADSPEAPTMAASLDPLDAPEAEGMGGLKDQALNCREAILHRCSPRSNSTGDHERSGLVGHPVHSNGFF